ncbi:MAG TPA: ABC transporter permease [Bacillota bacterium]|nr:ABC transporter permease [Bacillota bacterium]
MNYLSYIRRELLGRPWRTFFNAIGVAIGVAMVIILFSITISYQKAVAAPFAAAATDLVLSRPSRGNDEFSAAQGVILPAANQAIEQDQLTRLGRLPEVKVSVAALQLWSFDPGRFKVIMGVDPGAPAVGPLKAREWMKSGRFFKPGETGVAVVESHFARFYKLKAGEVLVIANRQFKITGVYEAREGSQLTAINVYLPLADAQALAGVGPNVANIVYTQLKDASQWRRAISEIHRVLPGLTASSVDSTLVMSDSLLALLYKLLWPAALIIIGICLLFVYRTLISSTMEKIGEFGIMKALGWRNREIRSTLLLELFAQVLIGMVIGVSLGAVGTYLTSLWRINITQISQTPPLQGMNNAANVIQLKAVYPIALYSYTIIGSLIVGVLAAMVIARRVASLKAAEMWRIL